MMTESVERGELIPLDRIYPNRLNPNEMEWANRYRLQEALKSDEYDPIVVSPLNAFYSPKDLKTLYIETEDGVQIFLSALNHAEHYVICDGQHRYEEAKRLGFTHIRATVWHMSENDAMPHFYKRHSIRGEFKPMKEADLFLHERDVNGLTLPQIAEKYNLSSTSYIRNRLNLLKVTPKVLDLFWEPPADMPGTLTITHLRHISELQSGRWQLAVARMALHRNWNVRDVEKEVRRIKAGKGQRDPKAYLAPLEAPPPDRPENPPPRPKPEAPPEEKPEPAPDEEIFKEYPDEFLDPEPEPADPVEPADAPEPEPAVEPAESASVPPVPEPKPAPAPEPPLVLSRELMEPFISEVLNRAYREGLNLNDATPKAIEERLDEAVYHLLDKGETWSLSEIGLRAAQLHILQKERGKSP